MSGYEKVQLAEIALQHMRTDTSGCHCGQLLLGGHYPRHLADALAPVVDRIATERAAQELREMASDVMREHGTTSPAAKRIRTRAIALDAVSPTVGWHCDACDDPDCQGYDHGSGDLATELAEQGLRACCGLPSEVHCR